jgi:adenosylcobinamide kinase/adenosylcobinamide-phosphate guanylyltransferase
VSLILVTGGSGSGKSAYAEKLLLSHCDGRAVYLATMAAYDDESRRRIDRHRAMRQRHGEAAGHLFTTVERPYDLLGAEIEPGDFVLLEDLGNLLSNELWLPGGAGENAEAAILSGVEHLLERAALVVIVSNEIFSDGVDYDDTTAAYIRTLAALHCSLAEKAQAVVEVVCGIPVVRKDTPQAL